MNKKLLLMACLVLFNIQGFAQRNPDAIIKMDGNIQDLAQNDITGVIVIKEGATIKGISSETKQLAWTLTKEDFGTASWKDVLVDPEFGKVFSDKRPLTPVPNSPYMEAYINSKYVIINTETGKIVYNSGNEPFMVFQSDFIPESDEYLLTLKEGPKITIALLDMKTGAFKWKSPVAEASSMLKALFSFKESANTNVAKIKGNIIYYLLYGYLYSFDKEKGTLNWKSDIEYTKFFPTYNGKNVVVINSKGLISAKQYLNVLNAESGKSIWEESIKTKRVVYLEDWDTKILVAHYSGFNFFDLKTGEKIWKKDARGDGLKRAA